MEPIEKPILLDDRYKYYEKKDKISKNTKVYLGNNKYSLIEITS